MNFVGGTSAVRTFFEELAKDSLLVSPYTDKWIKVNSKKKTNRLVETLPVSRIDRFIHILMGSRHEFCVLCETKNKETCIRCTECKIIYCIEFSLYKF